MKKIEGEEAKKLNRDWLRFASKKRAFQDVASPRTIRDLKRIKLDDDWIYLVGCVGGVMEMIRWSEKMTLNLLEIRDTYLKAIGETRDDYEKFLAQWGEDGRGLSPMNGRGLPIEKAE
jgi:hypothetical protein